MDNSDINLKASVASLAIAVVVGVFSFNSNSASGVESPGQDPASATGVHPIFTGVDVTGEADFQDVLKNTSVDGGGGDKPLYVEDALYVDGDAYSGGSVYAMMDIYGNSGYFGANLMVGEILSIADIVISQNAVADIEHSDPDGTIVFGNPISAPGMTLSGDLDLEGVLSNSFLDEYGSEQAVRVEDDLDVSGYIVTGIDYGEEITNFVKIYKDGVQSMVADLEINADGGGQDIILGKAEEGGEASNDTIVRGDLYGDGIAELAGDVTSGGNVGITGYIYDISDRILNVQDNLLVSGNIGLTGNLNFDDSGTDTIRRGTTTDEVYPVIVDDGLEVKGKVKAAAFGDMYLVKSKLSIPYNKGYYSKTFYCPEGYVVLSCDSYFQNYEYWGAQENKYITGLHVDLAGNVMRQNYCTFNAVNVFGFADVDKGLTIDLQTQNMCFAANKFDDGDL